MEGKIASFAKRELMLLRKELNTTEVDVTHTKLIQPKYPSQIKHYKRVGKRSWYRLEP